MNVDNAEDLALLNVDEDEALYEVESILDVRRHYGRLEFLIKWKNYDDRWYVKIRNGCSTHSVCY